MHHNHSGAVEADAIITTGDGFDVPGASADAGQDDGTELAARTLAAELAGRRDAALKAARVAAEHLALAADALALADKHHAEATAGAHDGFGHPHRQSEPFRRFTAGPQASRIADGLEAWRRALDADCWGMFLRVSGIRDLMDTATIQERERSYATDVPEFTETAMLEEFEKNVKGAGTIWRRGLANVFIGLDRRFKSHDGFKVGSRVVLTNVFDGNGHWNFHTHPDVKLKDVERAFQKLAQVVGGGETDPTTLPEVERWALAEKAVDGWVVLTERNEALHRANIERGTQQAPDLSEATVDGELMTAAQKRVFLKAYGEPALGVVEAIDRVRGGRRSWTPFAAQVETEFFRVNTFKNGNAHLWFTRKDLVERLNHELAIYYGATLGDAIGKGQAPKRHDPNAKPAGRTNLNGKRAAASTALAQSAGVASDVIPWDAQFYPTPPDAARRLVEAVENIAENVKHHQNAAAGQPQWYDGPTGPAKRLRVLEPSAGRGALIEAVLRVNPRCNVTAYEVHADRAAVAARRCPAASVTTANFLAVRPVAIYDAVVMNPPFGGTHWIDHVQHAWEFLAPGGMLAAILPASALVNETPLHERFRDWAVANHDGPRLYCEDARRRSLWRDLPDDAFEPSGINVQTVVFCIRKLGGQ
jgi:precorrin-6B methylase 2